MASKQKKRGQWYVSFRWAGRQYQRSCETASAKVANGIISNVEDFVAKLKQGRETVPDGVDDGDYILSQGTVGAMAVSITLQDAGEAYIDARPDKGENTIKGERKHIRAMCRVWGEKKRFDRIDVADIERYISKRLETVSPQTVHKELITYWQIWQWAFRKNHVVGHCPAKDRANSQKWAFTLPEPEEQEPWRTWNEIETIIEREGLDEERAKLLWKKLYLDETQVAELLEFVGQHERYSFMFLSFMLAAKTGMRRSEIAAARTGDVQLEDNLLSIRQKKNKRMGPIRNCVLSKSLRKCLEKRLAENGESSLVVNSDGKAMSDNSLTNYFVQTVKGSKWQVLSGWHCLRHSFGSICLRKRIPIHVTAKWMGHTTEEMIGLYQKLYRQDEQEFVKLLD